MATKKTTGKKLADMMYGNPEGAAFGIYPKAGKRSEDKQDREAAKNFPVDLARGVVAGAVGMPGDIESLIRMLPGLNEQTVLPTSEDVLKRIPFGTDTPAGQFASGLGTLAGGSAPFGAIPRAVKAAPGALKTAARNLSTPNTLNPQAGVIKTKGGNFLTGSVEGALKGLQRKTAAGNDPAEMLSRMRERYTPEEIAKLQEGTLRTHVLDSITDLEKDVALNNWAERNLVNYVKKEMATPEDPVRRLAEQGIVHVPPDQVGMNRYRAGAHRSTFGGQREGVSEEARAWEDSADVAISPYTVGEIKKAKETGGPLSGLYEPWMDKADEATEVYKASKELHPNYLGFDHIMDVLREDVASGRIRPEQLNKVSMEQAVRRTYEYDQEMAKRMRETALKQQEGFPVTKEYPEGYRWIELTTPKPSDVLPEGWTMLEPKNGYMRASSSDGAKVLGEDMPTLIKNLYQRHPDTPGNPRQVLEDALKYEGDTMGHCVGGYCPDVVEGRSRIYSLRDAKGEPHVTVEVQPPEMRGGQSAEEWLATPHRIVQIKGKQNRAPKEDYLPFVQDFVRSGQWSDVGDLGNTGLYKADPGELGMFIPSDPRLKNLPGRRTEDFEKAQQAGLFGDQKYFTRSEWEDILRKQIESESGPLPPLSEEGMARGGSVHFSDNPDVMQLELAGGGAVAKLARLARAPAKSKQEIEAIAERLAPQVTGEYVRKDAKSAKTVAGKTQKQFQREKTLPVDVRPTGEERVPELVDIEKLKGDVMIGIPGDPTLTGKTLYGVGDFTLGSPSPQHGGPLYGLYNDDAFWASGIGPARGVQNLAKRASKQYDAPVKGNYIMMGPDSINYAQHFADANLQAIDLSRMTKAQVDQFNELIRKGSKKSGPRESFPGIEDKDSAYLQMAMDPELRKHFNALMQMPTVTETLNLPSGTDIRFAITEPSLRDLETGVTGYSMGKMRPDIASKELPLSTHPTYDYDIPGEFMGQSRYPMPYELSFPDTLQSIRANPKQARQEFGSLKMVGPRQIVDQQMIDEIKAYEERMKALTGKKAGGAVRKAEGGEITADDLILEERKL
jgi:hypothetical protein